MGGLCRVFLLKTVFWSLVFINSFLNKISGLHLDIDFRDILESESSYLYLGSSFLVWDHIILLRVA